MVYRNRAGKAILILTSLCHHTVPPTHARGGILRVWESSAGRVQEAVHVWASLQRQSVIPLFAHSMSTYIHDHAAIETCG